MDKSIAQALNGLVPTLSGPIPPELQDLAVSLLAQSRSKASSLKADEEIARSYACANLACERCEHSESCNEFVRVLTEQHRLRRTLNLPKIQPRPPCPPKVYQKLYKFLDAALRTDIRRSERSLRTNEPTPIPTSSPAKSKTPTKRTLLKPTTPRKKTTQRSQTISDIPNWIMPTIRQLCKKFDTPRAPPHVFAGVSSILTLPSTRELDSSTPSRVKIPALIIAVFFLATTRLSGVETDADEYTQQRAKALELLKDGAMEHDREEIEETDVNECLRMVGQEGWADMDWFANIPLGSGAVAAEEADNDEDTSEDEEGIQDTAVTFDKGIRDLKNSSQSYLQAGLGTMMRDQVDYLSEKRRADYQKWKKGILIRIEKLKKADEMHMTNIAQPLSNSFVLPNDEAQSPMLERMAIPDSGSSDSGASLAGDNNALSIFPSMIH